MVIYIPYLTFLNKLKYLYQFTDSMKTIKQVVYFDATPHEVFELLMDSKKHSAFTGSKAKISREVNGKFEAYDPYIEGKNLEIVKDKKIVQSWRGTDWKKAQTSKAEFRFEKKGDGCKMTFTQTGVPEEHYAGIKQGWVDYYWKPMKEYISKA